jgi:hypothetical protein
VKIENRTDKTIHLNHMPQIVLEKTGLTKDEKARKGYSYLSYVDLKSDVEPAVTRKFLAKGEVVEGRVDITKIRWGTANQSHLLIDELFDLIPKSEYELYMEILNEKIKNNEKQVVYIKSNVTTVTIL